MFIGLGGLILSLYIAISIIYRGWKELRKYKDPSKEELKAAQRAEERLKKEL